MGEASRATCGQRGSVERGERKGKEKVKSEEQPAADGCPRRGWDGDDDGPSPVHSPTRGLTRFLGFSGSFSSYYFHGSTVKALNYQFYISKYIFLKN